MKDYNSFDFSIVSDCHLLAKELMVDSKDFVTFTKFDRKLLVESEELFKKSLDLVSENKSNFLILPGDLTKDGEKISHLRVKEILKDWVNQDKKRKIFILPGNHDINNSSSFNYRKNKKTENISPKDFLEIYDFCFENLDDLEMYKDSDIFKSYLNKINEKYNREEKYAYYAHGFLSYVTRINPIEKDDNGITILALDTSIYSCDQESLHKDGKENVPGFISESQMIWACDKISEAKKRKDLILVFAHHAIIPNFRDQELVFAPFIIKNWLKPYISEDKRLNNKRPIDVFADMKVKFIFTGHLHENGTAKYISEDGNEIFNIQTGSPITYPLPIRHVKVVDDIEEFSGFSLKIKTELIKDFEFENLKGGKIKVENASLYTLENQLSIGDVLFNYIKTLASKPEICNMNIKKEVLNILSNNLKIKLNNSNYVNQILEHFKDKFPINYKDKLFISLEKEVGEYTFIVNFSKSTIRVRASKFEESVENLIGQIERKLLNRETIVYSYEHILNKVLSTPIGEDYDNTIYDFLNYIYQYKPLDEEKRPEYIDYFIDKLNDPEYDILEKAIDYSKDEINEVYDNLLTPIKFSKDNSKKNFFNNLFTGEGLMARLTIKYLTHRLNNLKDLFDFISKPVFGKKKVEGVDVFRFIVKHKKFTEYRNIYTNHMFGTRSIRKFAIDLVESMSNEVIEQYQNEDLNELDNYFNYIEYDESKNKD